MGRCYVMIGRIDVSMLSVRSERIVFISSIQSLLVLFIALGFKGHPSMVIHHLSIFLHCIGIQGTSEYGYSSPVFFFIALGFKGHPSMVIHPVLFI